jgi:hypothetical protein
VLKPSAVQEAVEGQVKRIAMNLDRQELKFLKISPEQRISKDNVQLRIRL